MTDVSRRLTLERAVQATTAATILVFVLASGSILSWLQPARFLRWPALLVLAALSLTLALRRGGRPPTSAFAIAVAALAGLALLSVLWSPRPLLSGAHAGLFVLALATCAALAWAAWGRPDTVSLVVDGVLFGLALVAFGGLLLLAVEHDRAVMPATAEFAARYQGLGGGPNTATMVMALGVPLAAQRLLRGERWARVGAGVLLLVLLGSIVASGSRGALLAAFGGLAVFAVLTARAPRRKALALGGVAVGLLVAVAVMRAPDPLPPGTPSTFVPPFAGHSGESPFEAKGDFVDANFVLRLEDDVGHPGLGVADTRRRTRTLLNSSGRAQAWTGTLGLVAERPIAGYGFGLEDKVFVDRYVNFHSSGARELVPRPVAPAGRRGDPRARDGVRAPVRDQRVGVPAVSTTALGCCSPPVPAQSLAGSCSQVFSPSSTPSGATPRSRSGWPRSWSRLRRQRENVQQLAEPNPRATERRARLLVLNQYYWPASRRRGSCSRELCAGLAEDFDVTVVTGRLPGTPAPKTSTTTASTIVARRARPRSTGGA